MENRNEYNRDRSGLKVGKNLQAIREEKDLSMEFIARELGMDLNSYSEIEADTHSITDEILSKLSRILQVPIVDLIAPNDQLLFSNYGTANEQSFSAHYHQTDLQRIEKVYQDQVNHLKEEISYLRNLIVTLSSTKDWFITKPHASNREAFGPLALIFNFVQLPNRV